MTNQNQTQQTQKVEMTYSAAQNKIQALMMKRENHRLGAGSIVTVLLAITFGLILPPFLFASIVFIIAMVVSNYLEKYCIDSKIEKLTNNPENLNPGCPVLTLIKVFFAIVFLYAVTAAFVGGVAVMVAPFQ